TIICNMVTNLLKSRVEHQRAWREAASAACVNPIVIKSPTFRIKARDEMQINLKKARFGRTQLLR
ncbi:MAG: hypothetical protein AAGU05_16435, partial [Anaerolineaceae bacterium]